jgi:hypothetical protein
VEITLGDNGADAGRATQVKARHLRFLTKSTMEELMAHTHEYDCIVCGAHLDTSEELAHHNQELHIKTATGMERPRRDKGDSDRSEKREDPLPNREL